MIRLRLKRESSISDGNATWKLLFWILCGTTVRATVVDPR